MTKSMQINQNRTRYNVILLLCLEPTLNFGRIHLLFSLNPTIRLQFNVYLVNSADGLCYFSTDVMFFFRD